MAEKYFGHIPEKQRVVTRNAFENYIPASGGSAKTPFNPTV